MAKDVIELNDRDFSEQIQSGVVLVDFWAPWCAPCHVQTPTLEQVSAEVGDRARIAKVNVDEAPRIAGQFSIRSIPTLIVFRDGKPVEEFVGVQMAEALISAIETAQR